LRFADCRILSCLDIAWVVCSRFWLRRDCDLVPLSTSMAVCPPRVTRCAAQAVIREWLDEPDFRARLAEPCERFFFAFRARWPLRGYNPRHVYRAGYCLTVSAGTSRRSRSRAHPSPDDCSFSLCRSRETAIRPCEGILLVESTALRTNRRIRPLLAHLRFGARSESHQAFPPNRWYHLKFLKRDRPMLTLRFQQGAFIATPLLYEGNREHG
jgi:hypothetical protein